ncbi:MAG: tetratricopeptide repeat protein [Burkholderiales bacterium]|nr:tetratricopeptide repeat protein [Burkholderiales bacterium]
MARALCLMAAMTGVLGGCAQQAQRAGAASSSTGSATASITDSPAAPDAQPVLPNQELTQGILYQFLLAEIAGQRGNIGLAAQAYADLAKRTRDPRIARRATEIAVVARMPGAAIESARIWHETDPGSRRALQLLATLLVSASRFDEAVPHLKRLLSFEGANPGDAFLQLSAMLANVEDKTGALKAIQELGAEHARLPQAHFAVAQAASRAGDDTLALEEVRRAQALRPEWEPAVVFEAQLLQKKSAREAAQRLERHLQRYPNSREVRLAYARALVAEQRLPDARAQFQRLLADFPTNVEVVYAVALLALQQNDHAVAEANLRKLLDLDYRDKDTVRLYLGQVFETQKRFEEARRWYAQVGEGEQFIPAQIRYAGTLAKEGHLEDARAHLRRVAASDEAQRVQLVLAESQVLRDANRPREAFDLLGKALEARPDNPELLYDYAMVAERIDRVDILETSLRRLIGLRPDHAHAYNALGYSLADRNLRLPEARDLIEKALKLAPDDAFIVDSMGWVLYRMGDVAGSLTYLRKAFAERPDTEIGAHLGEVLWVSGDRQEAEKVWRSVIEKDPDNETLQKTIQRFRK